MKTIPDLLDRNAEEFGALPAYREKEFGIWQGWTWKEAAGEVESIALGLLDLGVSEGDRIAIIGRNRPHLYWVILASQCIGAIPVPLYQDAVAEEMGYALDHCGARFVVAGDQEQVDKVIEMKPDLPRVEFILFHDERGLRKYDSAHLGSLRELQEKGRAGSAQWLPELQRRRQAIGETTTCVILYTSGTTGRPKGVVLTHGNILYAARASSTFDKLSHRDSVLAYLPIAWVGDFIFSIGQACWNGFCVNCPESADTMMTDLKEIGPTYFFAPPRVFEARLTDVMIRMEDASAFKRWLFQYFMDCAGRTGVALLAGKPVGLADRLRYRIGDLLIYGPLRNVLGFSNIRVGYTAGEAIGPEIFDFYRSIGINLKQLYGQTEASVFITQQPDEEVKPDSVGVPTPGVKIRIDENGEVHFRSPGTFVEYYRNPESTTNTRDASGWVATGDAGFLDDTGHLRIIDRAKDVGKMADGRIFAPKYVENKLKFFPNILEAVVFGNNRESCIAMINIDLVAVGNWAERRNIAYASYLELSQHSDVRALIREHVEETNRSLADDDMLSGCQIRRFVVLHKELDADDGELTRTRKVRRRIIEAKYAGLIDALYGEDDTIFVETEVTYEDGKKGRISADLALAGVELAQQPRTISA